MTEHVWVIPQQLREAGLKLKPIKCHFLKRNVEYLGRVVSDDGFSSDTRKVEAVQNFPKPGLASYYCRFIQGFSTVANPLFALTRIVCTLVWSQPCEEAYEGLKELMTGAPLLAFHDFSRTFLRRMLRGKGWGSVSTEAGGWSGAPPRLC